MRIPVSLTEAERAKIEAAMTALGFRSLSDFMRSAALAAAARAVPADE